MARKVMNGLDLQNQKIIGLADGSAATDAVNRQQLDAAIRGLDWKDSVRAASTANLTLTAPGASIDGVTMASGNRFLAKNQSSGQQNGIYIWNGAAAAATRAPDADSNAEVTSGMAVTVTEGTVHGDQVWFISTNDPITLDTTPLVFTQLGGSGGTYTADGQGIEVSGNQFSIELDGTTLTKGSTGIRIGSGAAGAGLVEATGVLAVGAGAGITVAADAIALDTAVGVRKFATSVGNGALTTIPVAHNLGTRDVTVTVYDNSTFEEVLPDVVHTDTNTVNLTFAVAPTASQYRVVVHA